MRLDRAQAESLLQRLYTARHIVGIGHRVGIQADDDLAARRIEGPIHA